MVNELNDKHVLLQTEPEGMTKIEKLINQVIWESIECLMNEEELRILNQISKPVI